MVVVRVVDGMEPTPVLDTLSTSDECTLNVRFKSNDARLFKSWSISVEGNICNRNYQSFYHLGLITIQKTIILQ